MSLPQYSQYKDSGIVWLGEVPSHWQVQRLKYACTVFPSNVDKHARDEEPAVRLCNYTDVYYNERITSGMPFMEATASEDQIAKFTLKAGDTIITKDSETADDIAIAAYVPEDLPGVVCGYHLSMVRSRPGTVGAFVKRLFDSVYAKARLAVAANGLTRVGLGQYALDNVELLFPPHDEQTAIATFLDRETGKIDALIAEQEKLLALLTEKRQATISHAVTKGLNPDVPMKDSGVEWLSKVPAHWDIDRTRHHLEKSLSNGIFKKKDDFGSGALLVNVFDIYRDDFLINYSTLDRVMCSDEEMLSYQVKAGDLFFVRSSLKQEGIAAVAVAEHNDEAVVFECHLIQARFNPNSIIGRFASYLFNSNQYRAHMLRSAKVTTMTTIDQEAILSTLLLVPPLQEQWSIIAFLNSETAKLDILAAEATRAIELLKERRSALISAAVTGKIDVRSTVAEEVAA